MANGQAVRTRLHLFSTTYLHRGLDLRVYSVVTRRRLFCPAPARAHDERFYRSDSTSHGWTGLYDSRPVTRGPLKDASSLGVPCITPRSLKDHLDQFVVGQDRAKRALSVAVYNHYQRVQELERQESEAIEVIARQSRRSRSQHVHIFEDHVPGHPRTIDVWDTGTASLFDSPTLEPAVTSIEKSNIMLLGPSGVGKTLMAKTLSQVLKVPFSISDCTPFTQAGYIGEDADVCVHRLLAAADYDVAKAERGIICLDEIDKIAAARVSHGKDVSGEGVQQALLKIIEGTTLQIQAKNDKTRTSATSPGASNAGASHGASQPPSSKPETYTVRTDNILFICTGAFVGLHKTVLDRVSKGSIGFGATVRANQDLLPHETMIRDADPDLLSSLPARPPSATSHTPATPKEHNILDLVEPTDLQKYGLIPELVGRIPVTCALSALDTAALVRVLTEPRNSLLKQYEQLFQLSSIDLRITSAALQHVAATAHEMGTGARGLRSVLERVLADAMFETPGSAIKYVAVTEAVARGEESALYFGRDDKNAFVNLVAREEDEWEAGRQGAVETEAERRARLNSRGGAATTFEEYRQKTSAAGSG